MTKLENPGSRYAEIIEQIKRESDLGKKLDSLATMVFTMATNDSEENREEHREIRKENKKMKRLLIMLAIAVALLLISKPEILSILTFLKGLVF